MKSKRALRVLTIGTALAGLLAGGLTGCKGEDTTDEDTGASEAREASRPLAAETGSETAKPKKGESLREHLALEIELPDAYPDDVPVYPGAKVNSFRWNAGRLSVTFSTEDDHKEVTSRISQQLRSDGWLILPDAAEMPSGRGIFLKASKDAEARRISVMVATIDADTNDALTLIAVVTDPKTP